MSGLELGKTGSKSINKKLPLPGTAPVAGDTTGEIGDQIFDTDTLYVCVAKNASTGVATWFEVAMTQVV